MEDMRQFVIVADNRYKVTITACTKWHALDKALEQYPQYNRFQYTNIVRNRAANKIISKF